MGLFDGSGALGALNDLLDREKALILQGDIPGVQRLLPEKERLLTRVQRRLTQAGGRAGDDDMVALGAFHDGRQACRLKALSGEAGSARQH